PGLPRWGRRAGPPPAAGPARDGRHVDARAAGTGRGDADDAELDPGARIRAIGQARGGVGVPGAKIGGDSVRGPAADLGGRRAAGTVAAHADAAGAARAVAG